MKSNLTSDAKSKSRSADLQNLQKSYCNSVSDDKNCPVLIIPIDLQRFILRRDIQFWEMRLKGAFHWSECVFLWYTEDSSCIFRVFLDGKHQKNALCQVSLSTEPLYDSLWYCLWPQSIICIITDLKLTVLQCSSILFFHKWESTIMKRMLRDNSTAESPS